MQEHVPDDRIRALAVLHDFLEVATKGLYELGNFRMHRIIECYASDRLAQFVEELGGYSGKVIDEIKRVFDFVGYTGCQLSERGKFLGLHQAVLRSPQFLKRFCQLAG